VFRVQGSAVSGSWVKVFLEVFTVFAVLKRFLGSVDPALDPLSAEH